MIRDRAIAVLVARPSLPAELERVASVDRRIRVLHEPSLYPQAFDPAYPGWDVRPPWSPGQLKRWRGVLAETEVLFDLAWVPDPSTLPTRAPRLRWVQATISGLGAFLARSGIGTTDVTFTTAAGIHAVPLSEHVLYGLLHFKREAARLQDWKASHVWGSGTTPELHGSRVLVVGLGGVGGEIARVLSTLGVDVWGMRGDPSKPLSSVSRQIARSELLSSLAYVSALILACPLTPSTLRLIGANELQALPTGAVVVNVARGAVIDEPALIDALESGHLGGAVLDVTVTEPLEPGSRLWELDNVLLSPHNAGVSPGEPDRLLDLFVANLQRYVAGEPLVNVFDMERGY